MHAAYRYVEADDSLNPSAACCTKESGRSLLPHNAFTQYSTVHTCSNVPIRLVLSSGFHSTMILRVVFFLVLWMSALDVRCKGFQFKSKRDRQLEKLKNYDIVTPHRLDGRHKREAHTLTQDGHMTEASFLLPAFGKEYVLDVRLNEVLFPKGYVETVYTEDGHLVTRVPHKHHHCYYQGSVRGGNISAVAISTCNGVNGVVDIDGEALNIEPLEGSSREHVVYRAEDIIRNGEKLVLDGDVTLSESRQAMAQLKEQASELRYRRDILTETKYVELALINDEEEYRIRGSIQETQERSKAIANQMDMRYKALNIRIVLVVVEVWLRPVIEATPDPKTRLNQFQEWRTTDLNPRVSNDNAQLITGTPFLEGIVGMAEQGKMCTEDKSCGVNADIQQALAEQAVILTHEMGHNLGLPHNRGQCSCSESACIMDETLGYPAPVHFSSCTVDAIADVLEKGYGACLLDYPTKFFGGPVCGNGFLEPGEDCDCGTPEECTTPCCLPETCRLHANATCAAGQCCDKDCQMKPMGVLCRDVYNDCDLPEYCEGISAECPGNVYRQNGEKCEDGRGEALCYDGQCRSYQRQCEELWGINRPPVRAGHDVCFQLNQQGSHFASCGETDEDPCPSAQSANSGTCYKSCEPENVKCGRLMCEDVPDRPVLTDIATIAPARVRDDKGNEHTCKTVSLNFGVDVLDPGYVAEGTQCAEGKICLDFQCQNISSTGIRPCPYNCHGHGVCNSKNHCHCDGGWAPPLCDHPGNGGSVDSGPAQNSGHIVVTHVVTRVVTRFVTRPTVLVDSDGNQNRGAGNFLSGVPTGAMATLLVLFLLVFPLITCVAIIIYCKRQKLRQMINKSREARSRHHSFKSEGPASNGGARKPRVVRVPSLRDAPPTIEHIPNTSTGSVVHDVYPLVPTNFSAVKPSNATEPISPPAGRPTRPPTRPSAAPSRPTSPPPKPGGPARPPPLPRSKPTQRSQSFNVPPARVETETGDRLSALRGRPKPPPPPFKLAPPPKSPPPVPENEPLAHNITGARAALKPVSRPRPNVNANNSKDCDWRRGGDRITRDNGEEEPFITRKPTVSKKPSIPKKPPIRPGRPPLRTQSLREPSSPY